MPTWLSSKRGNQGAAGGETEGVQSSSAEGQEAGRPGTSSTLLKDQQGRFWTTEVWLELKRLYESAADAELQWEALLSPSVISSQCLVPIKHI